MSAFAWCGKYGILDGAKEAYNAERSDSDMIRAGFAHRCITPPPGRDIPGLFEKRIALGTHDDLYARAAVFDDGHRCVAFVQTDAITVPEGIVQNARRRARRLCGIAEGDCFISATHTHSGGPVFGGFLSEPDPEYPGFVAEQIAAAIAEAHRQRRAALVGAEASQSPGVAFNRRFVMRNGLEKTHPGKNHPEIVRAAGPEDATVTVVGCCDPETWRPFGAMVHFACHATHMNGLLYSADYVRWVVDTLQAAYGPDFGVVYLNGACGDITQVDNRSARPLEMGPYWCERSGRAVGAGALQALARVDYLSEAGLARKTVHVRAAIRASKPAERRAARELLRRAPITAENVETIYAHELLEVEALRKQCPIRRLEITGVRLADAFFWGVPAEFFQAYALSVRAASAFPHTCCVELANGYNGYICTPSAFAGGGYEVRTARSSFLEPDTGERIVRAAKRLCGSMRQAAERELEALPARRRWPAFADPSALDGISQLERKR